MNVEDELTIKLLTKHDGFIRAIASTKHTKKHKAIIRIAKGIIKLIIRYQDKLFHLDHKTKLAIFGEMDNYKHLFNSCFVLVYKGSSITELANEYVITNDFLKFIHGILDEIYEEVMSKNIIVPSPPCRDTGILEDNRLSMKQQTVISSAMDIEHDNLIHAYQQAILPENKWDIMRLTPLFFSYKVDYFMTSHSRRLFTTLQNVKKTTRAKLFSGWNYYDIITAMPTILSQHYYNNTGNRLPILECYIADSHKIRQEIQRETGISHKIIKIAISGIVNGARLPSGNQLMLKQAHSIFSLVRGVGKDNLFYLIDNKLIKDIAEEAREIKRVCKPLKPYQVYEDIERRITDYIIDETQLNQTLLIHDGFITKQQFDIETLKQFINEELRYEVKYDTITI